MQGSVLAGKLDVSTSNPVTFHSRLGENCVKWDLPGFISSTLNEKEISLLCS
jgi:hypothetical protein